MVYDKKTVCDSVKTKRIPLSEATLTILFEPSFGDQAAVADDGHGRQLQFFFAELDQFSHMIALLVNEGLASTEIQFFHAYNKNKYFFN